MTQATRDRPCEHEWVVGYDVAGDSVTTARTCKHCRAVKLETTTFSQPPETRVEMFELRMSVGTFDWIVEKARQMAMTPDSVVTWLIEQEAGR